MINSNNINESVYSYNVLVIIPENRIEEIKDFVKQNIDADGGDNWFESGLSQTGENPITHRWACFSGSVNNQDIKNK